MNNHSLTSNRHRNRAAGDVTVRLTGLRRAVTLIEVVFSMGVILIGLLGLLSILPLAGRRAQESVSLSVGTAIGEQMINELEARTYLGDGRLRPIPLSQAVGFPNLVHDPPMFPVGSFCLDPIFASSSPAPTVAVANGNRYSASQFPYYDIDHNPLADPSTDPTVNPWPWTRPPMPRVGITRENNPVVFSSVAEALEVAEANDDLLVSRPDDRTRNARFNNAEIQAVASGLEYGKRVPRGDFTWIATVSPLPDGQYASLSIVTLRKRERNFDTPTATAPPSSPTGNGTGERLAYVTYATGFKGGAGGMVHLVSNANTVPDLKSDDWIMLSRFVRTSGFAMPPNPALPPSASTGNFYHRWYRVVGVNGEPEEFQTDGTAATDDSNLVARFPNGPHQVWRHKVQLDGPDWSFDFKDIAVMPPTPRVYAGNNFDESTFATIASDVVSVTERIVLLSDL